MKTIIKNIKIFAALLCLGLTIVSCTEDFEEINTDKNTIATIGPAELPFLFSKAISSVPWNDQTAQNLYSDQYAQYFANLTSYFPTDRYVINMDWAQTPWNKQYTGVVPQLQSIFESTDPNSAEYALANIWWVYSFHRITDYWGPIPYFHAGEPGTSVPYDLQSEIYDDFFKRLDAAVSVLNQKTSETPFGNADLIYGGNVNKWIKFANTLRLRLALRISDVEPERAQSEAEAAYMGGVFTTSPGDDALAEKNSIDRNTISIMSEWNEFRMSAAMESALKGYQDPRISEYFIPAVETGTYEGLRNGLSVAQLTEEINKAGFNSHVGPRWSAPASGGVAGYLSTPANVMSTAEAYFARAEGALLGWDMGGTPEELYNAGIENSMYQWGITEPNVIQNYINSTEQPIPPQDLLNSPAVSDVPVKFDNSDRAIQLRQIALQKWIALFPDGWEAWAENRRRDLPPLYPVANSDNPEISDPTTEKIRRLPFLLSEYQTNRKAVEEAIKLLGGPDKITTPLWWDEN